MKIETNENLLVNVSVMGSVCQPNFQGLPAEPYRLDSDGIPFLLPTWGSIVHNVSVGDSAFGWEADCIHPGVSIKYPSEGGNRGYFAGANCRGRFEHTGLEGRSTGEAKAAAPTAQPEGEIAALHLQHDRCQRGPLAPETGAKVSTVRPDHGGRGVKRMMVRTRPTASLQLSSGTVGRG